MHTMTSIKNKNRQKTQGRWRWFLTSLMALACIGISLPACAADNVLRVLAWPGYADADFRD